jgi:hypothetical protein
MRIKSRCGNVVASGGVINPPPATGGDTQWVAMRSGQVKTGENPTKGGQEQIRARMKKGD